MIVLAWIVGLYVLSVLFTGFCLLQYQNLMVNYCDAKYETSNPDFRKDLKGTLSMACKLSVIPIFNLFAVFTLCPDVWYMARRAFFLKMYSFIKEEVEKEKIE